MCACVCVFMWFLECILLREVVLFLLLAQNFSHGVLCVKSFNEATDRLDFVCVFCNLNLSSLSVEGVCQNPAIIVISGFHQYVSAVELCRAVAMWSRSYVEP